MRVIKPLKWLWIWICICVMLPLPALTPGVWGMDRLGVGKAEGELPLAEMDPAVAEALLQYADQLGQPLRTLVITSDPELVTGVQAVETLTVTGAAALDAIACLPRLKRLTLVGATAQTLRGLENHPSLQAVTLTDCAMTDLTPLTKCPQLTALTLERNQEPAGADGYDLTPLASCRHLTALTLTGACVDSLTALPGMDRLTTLAVTNVPVAEYAPIARLSGLTSLRLYGAPGAQVAVALAGHGWQLRNAYIGDCDLTPEANAAIFRCTRLKSLGFEQVTCVDSNVAGWVKLQALSSLTMQGGDLSGLDFLAQYISTTGVKLENVTVGRKGTRCTVDFDKYFLKLTNVPSEEILKILAGKKQQWNYATLRMESGELSGAVIAAFAGMTGLLSLDAQAVAADAFKPENWRGFQSLQQLKLRDCSQAALMALSALPALKRLVLIGCGLTGEAAIAGLHKLTLLSLAGCNVGDWAFLDGLTCARSLTTLSIAGCEGLTSAAFAARYPLLSTLVLEDTEITDLTPLVGLGALARLYVCGSPIADYTPLASLPMLQTLGCGEDAVLPVLTARVERRRFVAVP